MPQNPSKLKVLFPLMLVVAALSGCSHPVRQKAVPEALTQKADLPGLPGVRYIVRSGAMPEIEAEGLDSMRKEKAYRQSQGLTNDPLPPASFLALSGGGDDGAFGAGLLCGWTKAGTRPEFKLVTGISTGALLAPFAFLGPSQDGPLREVYVNSKPEDILEPRAPWAAVTDDAMADNSPLGRLVAKHITAETLAAIGKEYAKGRLLMMATTNLDSRQAVIWNMTKIAASGHPDALKLFHKIMLASAAIPGAFPPAMIDVVAGGKPYQEMHVDGGAMAQVFVYPPSLKLGDVAKAEGIVRERKLYVVRNARLDSDWSEVKRQTVSIAGRAISSLIQTQGAGDLYRIYAIAQRDGVDYSLAYIPSNFKAVHVRDFDPGYMGQLFRRGYDMAAKGYPWEKKPPGL